MTGREGPASDERGPYQVVVTVGTDHHPFDRLVGWIEAWSAAHPEVAVLLQLGDSAPPSPAAGPGLESVAMIGYEELVAAMTAADAVVAQGGPAAIMDARSVGHRPIVVPRRASLGEHVDDHQVTFTAWMAERDRVTLAATAEELASLLDRALADPSWLRIPPAEGASATTLAAFAAVVDPLLAARPGR